jgi:hypothetical protein
MNKLMSMIVTKDMLMALTDGATAGTLLAAAWVPGMLVAPTTKWFLTSTAIYLFGRVVLSNALKVLDSLKALNEALAEAQGKK